ncbi:Tyrosine recombinase XerC [subsurface metagenome]
MNADSVIAFLKEIEESRDNSAVARNLRLSSLKTFFAYLISQDILRSGKYQKIISIPLKRSSKPLMEYLEVHEVKSIIGSISRRDYKGERDFIILNLLYNTGARVSEICNLKVEQIRFESPPLITIIGKGKKLRQVPLWKETAIILYKYLGRRNILDNPKAIIFLNSHGRPISRFGIRHIIQKRVAKAICRCPSLAKKRIGPHTFRHTIAMHMLQSGVELTVIKNWLGHVNLSTTHSYIEIDLEMKRKALAACSPIAKSYNLKQLIKENNDVINWLESL